MENREAIVSAIRERAAGIHAGVNQYYDKVKPYSCHLDMVADFALRNISAVCRDEDDFLPVIFGAYFHDSIEDARLTYNDVKRIAGEYMDERQALMATEIVYALTNDKGRTREERAGEKYYAGIRATPYAPFIKLCDRLANMTYSFNGSGEANRHMRDVYSRELPHFIESIDPHSTDPRLAIPQEMADEAVRLGRG